MAWTVLHLRPRCEKKMAGYCTVLGLSYYLPLRRETKIYQRRKVIVDKPVFPGYLFAGLDRDGRLSLQKTNLIVRILEPSREEDLLHDLDQVRQALGVDPSLNACEALQAGRYVRIKDGPFRGIEGVVAGIKANTIVRLNVDLIGQAVAVEVPGELIEPIE
jgi:transcription antitermination factor NusG